MNEIDMNSNLKLKIQMDEEILCGQKINIKIMSKSDSDMILNDLNIELFINRDMFRFIKKNFKSDIFKVKFEKLDDNIIKVNFELKKQISLNANHEEELLNFDLNVKKRISINESDIIFRIKINGNEQEFTKHVLVENNVRKSDKCKIKNISAESNFKDQKIQFDENVKNYKIIVPHDQQYIDFELCESFDGLENTKSKCVKLKKAGSSTLIKAGDYKIEVCRLENPEKTKKTKKSNKLKKSKKSKKTSTKTKKNSTKKNYKNKNMQSKIKNSNDIEEILDNDFDDENDEIDVFNDSKEESNDKISSVKKETINKENNNNPKILIGSCIISLILIGVCGFLWKKRKNKN